MIVCHGTATPVPPPPSPPQHSPCAAAGRKPSDSPVPQPGGSRAPARAATTPGKHPRFRSSCLGRAAAERQPVPPPSGPGGSRAPARASNRAATTPGQHPWVSCSPAPVPRSTALPRAARPAAAHHITAALLQQPVVAAATPQPCQSALVSLLRNHQLRQQP